jgi:hypothetical protein
MHVENVSPVDQSQTQALLGGGQIEPAHAHGVYVLECLDSQGNLKWTDRVENLVTTQGKNDALDNYLSGVAYTAAFSIGLIGAASYTTGVAVGDTAASHAGWVEDVNYSQANRPAAAFSAAAAGSKTTSAPSVFTINATTTLKGCILISNNIKGGTTGVLYSAGLFSGGDRSMINGDTLNVSYTANL